MRAASWWFGPRALSHAASVFLGFASARGGLAGGFGLLERGFLTRAGFGSGAVVVSLDGSMVVASLSGFMLPPQVVDGDGGAGAPCPEGDGASHSGPRYFAVGPSTGAS